MSKTTQKSTREERLLAASRRIIVDARRTVPSALEPGGLLHELAESVRAYGGYEQEGT